MDVLIYRDRVIRGPLDEAIHIVLGGPAKAREALKMSKQNLYALLGRGQVTHRDLAVKIEEATAAAGCRISAIELLELTPWQGPDRHPDPPAGSDNDGTVGAVRARSMRARAATAAAVVAHLEEPRRAYANIRAKGAPSRSSAVVSWLSSTPQRHLVLATCTHALPLAVGF